MKLIVGLGNPGRSYEKTRHNTGFIVLDYFASKKNVEFHKAKQNALLAECLVNGEKVYLLKPLSYMNLSGNVVKPVMDYYKIPLEDLLVISDDIDQPVGNVRLRAHGSSGGHNGLKNIAESLGTQEFKRMRIGISNEPDMVLADYVLGKFSKKDYETIQNNMDKYCEILEEFTEKPFEQLMSLYNGNQE